MDINKELLMAQLGWEEKIYKLFLKGKEGYISVPFSFGVSDRYINSYKRLMIVGQETDDFGTNYDGWKLPSIQDWDIKYLERQLYKEHIEEGFRFNRSPFWNFFRRFSRAGWDVAWNNIDKAHRYVNGITQPLTYEYEHILSSKFEANGEYASLIKREVDIARPSAMIFITGPYYDESISVAFGLDKDALKQYMPSLESPVKEISHVLGLDIPVLWTYHPNFLHFHKGLSNFVFEEAFKVLQF